MRSASDRVCAISNLQLTGALRSAVRCWPRCVHAHSTTSDRHRVVESEPIVATKRCHTAGFIAVSFCHHAVLGRVGVRARAEREAAAAAGCGAIPRDRASVPVVTRACEAVGVVGILNDTWSRCRNVQA